MLQNKHVISCAGSFSSYNPPGASLLLSLRPVRFPLTSHEASRAAPSRPSLQEVRIRPEWDYSVTISSAVDLSLN